MCHYLFGHQIKPPAGNDDVVKQVFFFQRENKRGRQTIPKMSASLNKSSVPFSLFSSLLWFCLRSSLRTPPSLCKLGDVDAMKVVGSEGTVALGALPLSGVVTHLQTFVAEHVETLGEHRLLVSCVAARTAQLGLETHRYIVYGPKCCLANTYYLLLLGPVWYQHFRV